MAKSTTLKKTDFQPGVGIGTAALTVTRPQLREADPARDLPIPDWPLRFDEETGKPLNNPTKQIEWAYKIEHAQLTGFATRAVWIHLCYRANHTGWCVPSVARMAKELGGTKEAKRTVRKALKQLVAGKWIVMTERAGTSNTYQIHPRFMAGTMRNEASTILTSEKLGGSLMTPKDFKDFIRLKALPATAISDKTKKAEKLKPPKPARTMSDAELTTHCNNLKISTKGKTRWELEREIALINEPAKPSEGGVRLDEVLGALDELVILGRMVEGVAGLERTGVVRFPIVTQRRLGFAMEKGARVGHRSGHVVVVLALDADEVEEVALAARYVVSPCPPQGA